MADNLALQVTVGADTSGAKVAIQSLATEALKLNGNLVILRNQALRAGDSEKVLALNAEIAANTLKVMDTSATQASSAVQQLAISQQSATAETSKLGRAFSNLTSGDALGAKAINRLSRTVVSLGFAAVTGLVISAVSALVEYASGADVAAKENKKFAESLEETRAKGEASGLVLKNFVDIARDQTQSLKTRNEALLEANKILGDHGEKLTLVNIATAAVTAEINKFTEATIQQALAAKYADRIADLLAKEADAKDKLAEATRKQTAAQQVQNSLPSIQQQALLGEGSPRGGAAAFVNTTTSSADDAAAAVSGLAAEVEKLKGRLSDAQLESVKLFGDIGHTKKGDVKAKIKETAADVITTLNEELKNISIEENLFNVDKGKERVSAYLGAIKTLTEKFKLDPDGKLVGDLFASAAFAKAGFIPDLQNFILKQGINMRKFLQLGLDALPPIEVGVVPKSSAGIIGEKGALPFNDTPKNNIYGGLPTKEQDEDIQNRIFLQGVGIRRAFDSGLSKNEPLKFLDNADLKSAVARVKTELEQLSGIVKNTLSDAVSGIGEDLGKALSGVPDGGSLFGNLFERIAEGMKEFGKSLIAFGVGVIAIKKLSLSPVLAIGAGIALEIAGSLLESKIPKFATGGFVSGPGGPTSDSIQARLSAGEYVIQAAAVNSVGIGYLDAINNGRRPVSGGGASVSGGGAAGFVASYTLKGADLLVAIQRAGAKNNRTN